MKNLSLYDRALYALIHTLAYLQALIYTRLLREPVWRSFDGRVTPISRLNDRHLMNIDRMITKDPRTPFHTRFLIRREIRRRLGV